MTLQDYAFDMLRDDPLSHEAIDNFNRHFEYAVVHYTRMPEE